MNIIRILVFGLFLPFGLTAMESESASAKTQEPCSLQESCLKTIGNFTYNSSLQWHILTKIAKLTSPTKELLAEHLKDKVFNELQNYAKSHLVIPGQNTQIILNQTSPWFHMKLNQRDELYRMNQIMTQKELGLTWELGSDENGQYIRCRDNHGEIVQSFSRQEDNGNLYNFFTLSHDGTKLLLTTPPITSQREYDLTPLLKVVKLANNLKSIGLWNLIDFNTDTSTIQKKLQLKRTRSSEQNERILLPRRTRSSD